MEHNYKRMDDASPNFVLSTIHLKYSIMRTKLLIRSTVILLALFSQTFAIGQSKGSMRAKEGEKVVIMITYVKAEAKEEYDKFMTEFFDILLHDKSPMLQEQYLKARWLEPETQNEDKTWTYTVILDPYVEDGDYRFYPLFERKVGKEAAKELMQRYVSFLDRPQVIISQLQSEH